MATIWETRAHVWPVNHLLFWSELMHYLPPHTRVPFHSFIGLCVKIAPSIWNNGAQFMKSFEFRRITLKHDDKNKFRSKLLKPYHQYKGIL